MTPANRGAPPPFSELTLKTTPPRAPRHLLARERLNLDSEPLRNQPAIVVQAPPGFGKTLLLAQWRREHLAHGAAVAWVSADAHDDPQRFLQSLVLAVRVGGARPEFGRTLLESPFATPDATEGLTAWLAEVAQSALDLVLIVDEAERLSPVGSAALLYLLHNAPANLRIVVAARGGFETAVDDLSAYGQCVCLGPEALRFRLDETLALVRRRFGERVDTDSCARLHEFSDGWPLGLQLALAAMEKSGDPRGVIDAMQGQPGVEGENLVGSLLARLAPEDVAFLTRLALVDMLHPDLCRALLDDPQAPAQFARLMRDTSIFMASDGSDWCRLHTLARAALGARLAELPPDELAGLHRRAMRWLAEHGIHEEAARHAHAAGEREVAFELAGRSLYGAVMQGRLAAALEWLELLPGEELDRQPDLRLAAAWALALSERHAEAGQLVAPMAEAPDCAPERRYECALILSVAAYYADEPDRFLALLAPWREPPPLAEPRQIQTHANRLALAELLQGEPANARRHLQLTPRGDFGKAHRYAAHWGEFVSGLSYLSEGQAVLAETVLRPALTSAEAELGRRHPLPCMLAAVLAAALFERDCVDEADALLANRLDVLERAGTAETSLLAYVCAARVAQAQGVERRALDLLEAMHAAGTARELPRLCIASLAERVRIHAGHARAETCRALSAQLDTLVEQSERTEGADEAEETKPSRRGPLWHRDVTRRQAMTHAYTALAEQNWTRALEWLSRAQTLADAMKLGRERIEIMGLRALASKGNGEDGLPLLREAIGLTGTYGLVRVFADAHPALADWVRGIAQGSGEQAGFAAAPLARMAQPGGSPRRAQAAPRAVPSMVLTPKEREVLELLARNLSNKEIAQAIGVGEVTAKWHVKNLFGKLSASSRKHAVLRAQLLGLLESGD
ncbi:LuxR C-terminal-related transcriptional regulator [Paraburkholderia tagetis]|uniref:LuxR C-terminal-related transcriptional regulator n=1 Tax=Paraburkholderia tagetis TaxID=2913261 RepID=A0A9X1UNY2_9BURK|nr:LuxR C-terminal-related transcriptional regulator [Paraburkholderia tagetis]MCG5078940.1 LuxR C-terminal-related transcriptional regulator [Paraburkholderia tagetis]